MISRFLDNWIVLPHWQKVIYCLLCAGLLTIVVWMRWGQPAGKDATVIASKKREAIDRNQKTVRQIHQYGAMAAIAAEIAGLEASAHEAQTLSFSPLALLEEAGGQLLAWQPQSHGGNLTLLLSWEQVKNVLLYLSERRGGIVLRHFSLTREEERLRLEMALVMSNEI